VVVVPRDTVAAQRADRDAKQDEVVLRAEEPWDAAERGGVL
jgi:hypothetical protein